MKGIGLIFVACCLVQSGCVSPYNFYSEAELLQMVSDYEAGRSLSANPNVLGSPVGDSAFWSESGSLNLRLKSSCAAFLKRVVSVSRR